MFRASLPSIIVNHNACHAIYHHLTQPWQCDSQKTHNTIRLKWCTRHANRRLRSPNLCACQETWNSSSENLAKCIALVRKTTWERHVRMSQSAMPRTRNDAARRFKPPKVTTPRRHGHRVPTQSCFRRLLTVASTKAASSEHRSTPRPQSKTRTLRAFGIIREKYIFLTIHGIIQQKSAKYDQSIPPCLMDNHQWQRIVHSAHPRKI